MFHRCFICHTPTGSACHYLCCQCENQLPWLQQACRHCARPCTETVCKHCQIAPPVYDRAIAAMHYTAPIPFFVTRLKFWRQTQWAKVLGYLLAKAVMRHYHLTDLPYALLPVPLHLKRLKQRGYNQATLIAQSCQSWLPIMQTHAAKRHRQTLAQTEVRLMQRQQNVRHAFAVEHALTIPHVAVIDDVMTTGSTLQAIATALKQAGVKRVDVWVCARAIMRHSLIPKSLQCK